MYEPTASEHSEAVMQVSDAMSTLLKPALEQHGPTVILDSLIDLIVEVTPEVLRHRVEQDELIDYATCVDDIQKALAHAFQQPLGFSG